MNEQVNNTFRLILKKRDPESHKGNYGHAIIVSGNKGKMGAAVITAKACLRSGVGLLTVSVPNDERYILQIAVPEAMTVIRESALDLSKYSAACIGPGIGIGDDIVNLVTIDADALNIISLNKLIEKIKPGCVLTPHAVEFDRLFGIHNSNKDRMTTAIEMANKHSIVIVLKGHHSLVTSGGEVYMNQTGNAGLAKGGSGDALSGIICSFLAQGYPQFDAAKLGVYIHGMAADIALDKQSLESMLITDVIERLGDAFWKIQSA